MKTEKLIIDNGFDQQLQCYRNEYGNIEITVIDSKDMDNEYKEIVFLMREVSAEKLITKLQELLSQKTILPVK